MTFSLGLDIGACAVKLCVLDAGGGVRFDRYAAHRGRMHEVAGALVREAMAEFGARALSFGAVTGAGSEAVSTNCAAARVNDIAALAEGALSIDGACRCVASIGGQSAVFVTGLDSGDRSRIQVSMNASCSSGTGSFLDEQVSRLGLAIEDYAPLALRAGKYPRIAGRCSVFAKTDITHHQQEGAPVEEILLGLAHSLVKNYKTAVLRKLPMQTPLLLAGGLAQNQVIVRVFRQELGLDDGDCVVSAHSAVAVALGAAVLARRQGLPLDAPALLDRLENMPPAHAEKGRTRLPTLWGFGTGDALGRHECRSARGQGLDVHLGVDVGSTSTNLVLLDPEGRVLDLRYLRTAGDPVRAVRQGLAELAAAHPSGLRVLGVGVTGSGRNLIGRFVGADVVRDEITAQACAAVALAPDVETVLEIGGQDSKYIAIQDGRVVDFQMNKVCAAGTGSFLEEQAKKLGIRLADLADLALSARTPVDLGERCTVFMEASVATHRAQGAEVADIAAGLCFAVAKNYLNRVVGSRRLGGKVLFQGGLAFNQGVVNAFRALTGREVLVPPYFSVTGAYGAALLAREEMGAGPSRFRGFHPSASRADTGADIGAGGEVSGAASGEDAFSREVAALVFEGDDPVRRPGRPTVGMPRALFTYGMYPMFATFFRSLGCNVLLSDPTSEKTIALGQEYSLDETCYPLKLINGHAAELLGKGVDALFFPDLYTVNHPGSKSRQNYGCAYMQQAFRMVDQAMSLGRRGVRLLAPSIAFSLGPQFMRGQFLALGRELGCEDQRTGQACRTPWPLMRASSSASPCAGARSWRPLTLAAGPLS